MALITLITAANPCIYVPRSTLSFVVKYKMTQMMIYESIPVVPAFITTVHSGMVFLDSARPASSSRSVKDSIMQKRINYLSASVWVKDFSGVSFLEGFVGLIYCCSHLDLISIIFMKNMQIIVVQKIRPQKSILCHKK